MGIMYLWDLQAWKDTFFRIKNNICPMVKKAYVVFQGCVLKFSHYYYFFYIILQKKPILI